MAKKEKSDQDVILNTEQRPPALISKELGRAIAKCCAKAKHPRFGGTVHVGLDMVGERPSITATNGKIMVSTTGEPSGKEEPKTRMPTLEMAMPKGEPVIEIRVDPNLLAKIAGAAAVFYGKNPEDPIPVCLLRVFGDDKVLHLTFEKHNGAKFDGLLVPMAK